LIKIIIKEENFKLHLEAFASELFSLLLLLLQSTTVLLQSFIDIDEHVSLPG